MKKTIITLSVFFFVVNMYGQNKDFRIDIEKKRYYQNEERLSIKDLKAILSENTAAKPEYDLYLKKSKIAAPIQIGAGACILVGGVLSLSSSMKQVNDLNNDQLPGEYNGGLGFMGAGLLLALASLPFSIPAGKHLKNSVDLHNSSLSCYPANNQMDANLILSANGIGLRLRF